MIKKDYYEILGVDRSAETDTIKKAYKSLAMQFHPDRNPDNAEAEERFKEASEAYQVLSDQEKRNVYDRFGHDGLRGQGYQGFSGFEDIFSSMGSIFEDLFGGFGGTTQRRGGPRRGADLRFDLELELAEAAFGTEKAIDVQKYAQCLQCQGTGAKPGTDAVSCPTCGGAGAVRRSSGFFSIQTTCPQCGGAGKVIQNPCDECSGSGRVVEATKVNVKIPAGIEEGMKLRIAGKGEDGTKSGPPGDLYVVVFLKPHEFLERHGQELVMRLPVTISQATLGAQTKVPSLDGEINVTIPKGTQHGNLIRVKGKGVPHLKGYGRGDMLIETHILVPKKISKRQEELMREFAEIEGEKSSGKSESLLDKIKHFATGE
jgi:molecular chaperone DnaJ